jgi:SMODS and SLOG-associating 2TM effector domain 1
MTREDDFRRLYAARRFEHQRSYYRDRTDEFTQAKDQLVYVSAVLLAISAFLGVLAGIDFDGKGVVLALGAIVPAISTALIAYDGLYAFDRHARLYGDAERALERIGRSGTGDVAEYVDQVEAVLHSEQAQWGQLESELRAG